jgi:3-oxoacyl-[acyl-carrier protein] reductase
MQTDLSGQTILLTGAAGRLGRVLAPRLAAAGARVAAADLEAPSFDHASITTFAADVSREADTERLFSEVAERVGPLDALIHTVGMWAGAPLAETPLADFEEVLRVNLTSTFLCFREAVRHFRGAGRPGRLVALASRQGVAGGVAEQPAYSAAKAGVVRLVESAAAEGAPHGITAAAVAPSMILYGSEPAGTAGVSAERVAALCAYLASPAGRDHNGAVLAAFGA